MKSGNCIWALDFVIVRVNLRENVIELVREKFISMNAAEIAFESTEINRPGECVVLFDRHSMTVLGIRHHGAYRFREDA